MQWLNPFQISQLLGGSSLCTSVMCGSNCLFVGCLDVNLWTHLEGKFNQKVCCKLQGKAVNTDCWVTSIRNERGEIAITALTLSEGATALKPLADG